MKEIATRVVRIVHAAFFFALPFLTAFLLSGAITARKAKKSLRCSDPEKRKIRPVCSAGILAGFLCAAFVYFFIGNFPEFSFLEYLLIESFLVMAALPYFILGCVQDSFNLKMETRAAASFVIVLAQILLCFLSVFIDVCEISSVFYLILLLPIAFCFLGSAYDALRKVAGNLETAFWGLVIALVFQAFHKNVLCFGIFVGGALLAPLVWNLCFKPRIRLGTGAGLFLGVCATFLVSCIVCDFDAGLGYKVCLFCTLLAFPIYDACSVVLLRSKGYRDLSKSWHDHFAHRLLRGGFPLWAVNLITFAAAGVLPAVVLALPEYFVYAGFGLVCFFLLFFDVLAALLAKRAGKSSEVA